MQFSVLIHLVVPVPTYNAHDLVWGHGQFIFIKFWGGTWSLIYTIKPG